jgi:ribonuclease HI
MTEQEICAEFPVVLYTDGACINNGLKNSEGGFAYVLLWDSAKKELWYSNYEQPATNNRMELKGILSGLREIKYRWYHFYPDYPKIAVISDSKYCVNGASSWMYNWEKKGWSGSKKKKGEEKFILNIDLWKEMFDLCKVLRPSFFWVKGHSGNKYNEICDNLSITSLSLPAGIFKEHTQFY